MSTKNTQTNVGGTLSGRVITWPALANGEAGDPVGGDFAAYSDRSVQIDGTFGAGGAVTIEGSLDGITYYPLSTPAGVALALTTAGLKQVLESVQYIRPRCTAGDGTTALKVQMYLHIPTRRNG
jgi:hypothetical protein